MNHSLGPNKLTSWSAKRMHLYVLCLDSKKMLSPESKQRLCEALVLSHFNYCDVLFPHLKTALESKIQKVQNCCVRFIFNIRKYDREHITPYILKLGWLNMKNRRLHHSLTLMYKIDKKNCSQLSYWHCQQKWWSSQLRYEIFIKF